MRKRAYFATVGLQKTTGRLALPRHGGHKTRLKAKRGAAALYSCATRKTPLTEGKMSIRSCVYIAVPQKKRLFGRQKHERLRLTLHREKICPAATPPTFDLPPQKRN